MKQLTENDFIQLRNYLSVVREPGAEPTNKPDHPYAGKSYGPEEIESIVLFLIDYYSIKIQPIDNLSREVVNGEKPDEATRSQQLIDRFQEDKEKFLNEYAGLLEEMMQHYEAEVQEQVKPILGMPVGKMTGQELLLLLQEHHRQVRNGVPLVLH